MRELQPHRILADIRDTFSNCKYFGFGVVRDLTFRDFALLVTQTKALGVGDESKILTMMECLQLF